MTDEFDWEGAGLADWQGRSIASEFANEFTLQKHEPEYVIQINGNNNTLMVGIKYDGTLVYGEDYTPDAAAKIFWDALVYHMPGIRAKQEPKQEPTPWAVICPEHGLQYLTSAQYTQQMWRPGERWTCPVCGSNASWDDATYDNYMNEPQGE